MLLSHISGSTEGILIIFALSETRLQALKQDERIPFSEKSDMRLILTKHLTFVGGNPLAGSTRVRGPTTGDSAFSA